MTNSLQFAQLSRAGVSFATVIAAYFAYSTLAVPLIEPSAAERPPGATVTTMPPSGASRHAELLAQLYPDPQAWQRKNPKIVETDQAVLLLKDYATLPDGRMELKPCSLLMLPRRQASGGKPADSRVVVLDAPEGAILQFDQRLDLRKAEFGRLVGGRLVGEVTIRSHGGSPEDDQLFLSTRNVNMDERRIWTPHDVYLRYGRNYGEGQDLIITLLPGGEATGPQRGPNIGGIKSLELVHLERLHLVGKSSIFPEQETLARSASEGTIDGDAPSLARGAGVINAGADERSPFEITCQGPFLLDFETSIATFEDQVNVLRLNADGPSDQLNCRLLEIHFAPDMLNLADRKEKADSTSPPADAVRKVVALGHPVVLQSSSMDAQARGDRLEYDLTKRQFRLAGQQPVMLEYGGRRVEAREVQYQLPEEGRIGRAWAQGPGRFSTLVEGPTRRELAAVWQGELTLRPDGGQHVLSLLGGATVSEKTFGKLSARAIHLWLVDQQPSPAATAGDAPPGILPDRLLAENNVQLASPSLTGATDRFEVWFHHIPEQAAEDDGRQTLQQDSDFANSMLADAAEGTGSRYHVSGKLLRIMLAVAGHNTQLRDVSIEGDAHIRETQTPNPSDAPLLLAGQVVHVKAADSDQAKAVIVGQPAHISGRGVSVEGASVHVDRAANLAWVPGAGKATLPMSGLGAAARKTDFQVRSFRVESNARTALEVRPTTGETATITWRDGMQFDGRTVQLRGEVVARTKTQHLAAPALDVALTRHIDFSDPPTRSKIDVAAVQFHGQVTAESRTYEQEELVAVDTMLVRQLKVDNQTGALTAEGPGWMKTVRRGAGQIAPPTPGGQNIRPVRTGNDDGLTYVRVSFQSRVTGNVHERYAQLHEDVRAVYGPVERWDETIDPDQALASRQDVILLTSDLLQIAEMGKQPSGAAAVEMQALGNALVEGSKFTARAHRIAYSQAKDMLLMEGDGRSNAELYRQTQPGAQAGRAAARKIVYWPSTGRMDIDTFHSFDSLTPFMPGESGNFLPAGIGNRLRNERENRQVPPATAPR